MGEIGGLAEADLEGEAEVGGGGEGLGDPVFFGRHEHGGEVEEIGLGRGELEVGDEGIDEGGGFLAGGFLGGGIGVEEEEIGTAGEAAGGAEAGVNAELAGGLIDRDEVGLFALTGGEKGGGLVWRGAISREEGAEGEVAEVEGGVVHGAWVICVRELPTHLRSFLWLGF